MENSTRSKRMALGARPLQLQAWIKKKAATFRKSPNAALHPKTDLQQQRGCRNPNA